MTNTNCCRILAALLLAIGVVSSSLAQVETGTVTGTLEVAGAPHEGARIVAHCTADSSWEAETVTDEIGSFSLSGVPLGAVSVRAYDADEQLVAQGGGELTESGEILDLELDYDG